jgi:hypothetical protein
MISLSTLNVPSEGVSAFEARLAFSRGSIETGARTLFGTRRRRETTFLLCVVYARSVVLFPRNEFVIFIVAHFHFTRVRRVRGNERERKKKIRARCRKGTHKFELATFTATKR